MSQNLENQENSLYEFDFDCLKEQETKECDKEQEIKKMGLEQQCECEKRCVTPINPCQEVKKQGCCKNQWFLILLILCCCRS